jgi:uncharacterized protein YoxC
MKNLFTVLVVYAVINLILYGGQEVFHAGDKQAYDALSQEMEQKKADIETKRGQIQNLEATIEGRRSQIERIEADVHSTERQYASTGAPDDVYSRYKGMITEGNALIKQTNLMVDQHNRLVDSFNAEVAAYNAQVPQINDLGHRAFDRWILIPIPLGRHAPAAELGPARGLVPVPAR